MKYLKKIFGGEQMTALSVGTTAPDFSLPAIDGRTFSSQEALARGPIVAAFFKVSCPVCQYAFPFIERIFKNYDGAKVNLVGISQNDKKDTIAFVKKYGVTFPVLLDDTNTFSVSNAYGLTNVPSIFWINHERVIELSSVGWSRQDIEEIARKVSEINRVTPLAIFHPDEKIAEFRAG